MTQTERLWALIPTLYKNRDPEHDHALRRLIETLGSELERLDLAIEQLADDHFVERASPEALLHLAELLGAHLLGDDLQTNRGVVARTIAWNRRRGTLDNLEELLRVTTGWSAEADEGFRSIAHTQDLRNPDPWRGRTAHLRSPIAMADPLSRVSPALDALGPEQSDTVAEALHRLGRPDAGRFAISPRSLDIQSWVRPEKALLRTTRLVTVEIEDRPLQAKTLSHTDGRPLRGASLHPEGLDQPLVWLQPLAREDLTPALSTRHEPEAQPPPPVANALLTPTALAQSGDLAEAQGALELRADGIQLVGGPTPPASDDPVPHGLPGPLGAFGLADPARAGRGDVWQLKWVAHSADEDRVIASRLYDEHGAGALKWSPDADLLLAGREVQVLVRRLAGSAFERSPEGTWTPTPAPIPAGEPKSPVVTWSGELYRVDLAGGTLLLSRLEAGAWVALPLAGLDPSGPVLLVPDGARLLLVGQVQAEESLSAFEVTTPDTAPGLARLSIGPGPSPRDDAAACTLDGRLYLHGGRRVGNPQADLWVLDGSTWSEQRHRNPVPRSGGFLLPLGTELVRIGGASAGGELDLQPFRITPSRTRPKWSAMQRLPLDPGPGQSFFALVEGGLVGIAWADRVWPRTLSWTGSGWELGEPERDAPNPPACGSCALIGSTLHVVVPSPLPASQVVVRSTEGPVLLSLPPQDRTPHPLAGDEQPFDFEASEAAIPDTSWWIWQGHLDGHCTLALSEGQADPQLRPGQGITLDTDSSLPNGQRYATPGRLSEHPYVLRQRALESWDKPVSLSLDGVVGLDPRLGRVILPPDGPDGLLSAGFRVGRPSRMGPGMLTAPDWASDMPMPSPPGSGVEVWVDPPHAGTTLDGTPRVADLRAARSIGGARIRVVDSARLPPARLGLESEGPLHIAPSDPSDQPVLAADTDGLSLRLNALDSDDAPIELYLDGLDLLGGVRVAVPRGQIALNCCSVAPGRTLSLDVAGAGHQSSLTRMTLAETTLHIHLRGCHLGRVRLAPWVHLHASRCTFDPGHRDRSAIDAAGARLSLQQCTVYGGTRAGLLQATGCVFASTVQVDRREEGWVRYSLLCPGGTPPRVHRSPRGSPSFVSSSVTHPQYLQLSPSTSQRWAEAGPRGTRPGAHPEIGRRLRELNVRTHEHLPMTLVPQHEDRALTDLNRMATPRRTP